jgi:putative membrane protein
VDAGRPKDVVAMMWDNGDGRWQMHDGDAAGWLMVILMLVLVVAVVVIVVAVLRGTMPLTSSASTPAATRVPDARAILRERFARGDIDESDFRSRMRALDEEGPAGG